MALSFDVLKNQPHSENIVVNLSLYNPVNVTSKIPAVIDIGLEKPILKKCTDYKLTILRFQCPLTSVKPPYSLNGKTLSVTIQSTSGASDTQTITVNQEMFSVSDFLIIVNQLLYDAHDNVYHIVNNTSNHAPTWPYIYFQPENRLYYLVLPYPEYIANAITYSIYFNEQLYTYFSGFPAIRVPNFNGTGQDWYNIRSRAVSDQDWAYVVPQNPPYRPRWTNPNIWALRVTSEYPTDYRLNQLQSILVTSNIPVRQETIPLSTQQSVQNPQNPVSYIATLPILTDFRPDVDKFGLQNSSLIYFPQSQYRWIDLINDGPLDRLSFNFLWQATDQSINQIYLSPGESVSLKLYFVSLY